MHPLLRRDPVVLVPAHTHLRATQTWHCTNEPIRHEKTNDSRTRSHPSSKLSVEATRASHVFRCLPVQMSPSIYSPRVQSTNVITSTGSRNKCTRGRPACIASRSVFHRACSMRQIARTPAHKSRRKMSVKYTRHSGAIQHLAKRQIVT